MRRALLSLALAALVLSLDPLSAGASDRPPPPPVESPVKWRLHLSEGGKSSYYGLWRDGGTIPLSGSWACRYGETRSRRNRTRNAVEESVTLVCHLDDAIVETVVACSYPSNPARTSLVSPSDSGHLVLHSNGSEYRAFVMVTCRALSGGGRRAH